MAGGAIGIGLALVGADSLLLPWLSTLGQYVPPRDGIIIADFLLCWKMSIPKMEDVRFTGIRWIAVVAYVIGAVVAVLTAGQVIPGVAAPQVIPGPAGAALNGLVASFIDHTLAYYLFERRGLLSGYEVAADANRL